MNSFAKKFLVWAQGALAFCAGNVVMAIAALLGTSVFGAADFTPRQIAVATVTAGVIALAGYLKQSPIPTLTEDDF